MNGTLTVDASATDRNGNAVSDIETATLDVNSNPDAQNETYNALQIDGLLGEYYAYQQGSGSDGSNLSNLAQVENFVSRELGGGWSGKIMRLPLVLSRASNAARVGSNPKFLVLECHAR